MKEMVTVISTTLSVLTLILLYKQYSNQRYRVKMDLFDRRFKVYSHVRKFILSGSKEGGTKLEVVQKFMSDVPEYEFIFDNDGEIVKYINDLLDKGLDYSHLQEQVNDLISYPVGYERDQLIEKKRPYGLFFLHEYENVKHRFSKYLHLGEVEDDDFLTDLFKKIRRQTGNLIF